MKTLPLRVLYLFYSSKNGNFGVKIQIILEALKSEKTLCYFIGTSNLWALCHHDDFEDWNLYLCRVILGQNDINQRDLIKECLVKVCRTLLTFLSVSQVN